MDRLDRSDREPHQLGDVLSQLFALKGYGRVKGQAQLQNVWSSVAGEKIANQTRIQGVKRGTLLVAVVSSALLNELALFHKASLLERIQNDYPEWNIQDIKFRLRGNLSH